MKRIATAAFIALSLCAPLLAQTPPVTEPEQISALIKEIQAQQIILASNQTKLEEKLAALSETIRQARIYSSRGGR